MVREILRCDPKLELSCRHAITALGSALHGSLVNPVDEIAAARLVEFLDPSTPWNRSLWSLSTALTLRETLEAAEANRAGILSDESVKRLGQVALRLVGKDPGVPDNEKQVLADSLRSVPRYDGLFYHTIAQLAGAISADYLLRWSAALNGKNLRSLSVQRVASHPTFSMMAFPESTCILGEQIGYTKIQRN